MVRKIKRKRLKTKFIDFFWMKSSKNSKRFIEIDLLRGLAILLMVFGHVLWDLDYFNLIPVNGFVYSTLQKIVPTLFFLLAGVSIVLGRKKKVLDGQSKKAYNEKLFVRGLKIFTLGVVLTIFSLIIMPERPILFGVLHCIGLSVVLSVFFLKYRFANLFFGLSFIILGLFISNIHFSNPSIFHLVVGLHQSNAWMYTIDYFPLLPWFGVTLLGIGIGDLLYAGDKRRFKFPDLSKYRPAKTFSWLGRHSLEIYLFHQPALISILYLFIRFF